MPTAAWLLLFSSHVIVLVTFISFVASEDPKDDNFDLSTYQAVVLFLVWAIGSPVIVLVGLALGIPYGSVELGRYIARKRRVSQALKELDIEVDLSLLGPNEEPYRARLCEACQRSLHTESS